MNEEIDIIELLKRVKEGKAPQTIEINGDKYYRNVESKYKDIIDVMYCFHSDVYEEGYKWWLENSDATLDTKIKILDKPTIEELTTLEKGHTIEYPSIVEIFDKINEIIRKMNEENKE